MGHPRILFGACLLWAGLASGGGISTQARSRPPLAWPGPGTGGPGPGGQGPGGQGPGVGSWRLGGRGRGSRAGDWELGATVRRRGAESGHTIYSIILYIRILYTTNYIYLYCILQTLCTYTIYYYTALYTMNICCVYIPSTILHIPILYTAYSIIYYLYFVFFVT